MTKLVHSQAFRSGGFPLTGALFVVCLSSSPAQGAQLQQVSNFGDNPSGITMYLYVPDGVGDNPPILVGVHACHGVATDVYSGTSYASSADRYGYIVIYPSASTSDGCWDVSSTPSLTHDGGGDSAGIVSMVEYVLDNYGADPDRVFATGHSSGGMMTNVLLGSYPDVFRAGSAYAGVPFACFAGSNTWSSDCAEGRITRSGQEWGDLVRAAYSGYTGSRPRMQLWHGTGDDTLYFHNFGEEIKQWTNVLGVSETPATTENDTPQSSWIRTRYTNDAGDVMVEAIEETGQPHNLRIMEDETLRFFGLDGSPIPSEGGTGGTDSGGTGGTDSGGTATGGTDSGGTATGGTATGGTATGGTSTGGTATGGTSTGGTATGGTSTGGTGGTGGATDSSSGGSLGGSMETGGASLGTGGTAPGVGGSTGGASPTSTGGADALGAGGSSTGGSGTTTGGTVLVGSGGATASGGNSSLSTGGVVGTGGTTGASGSTPSSMGGAAALDESDSGASDEGCSCSVPGTSERRSVGWLLLGLSILGLRRRNTTR